MNMFKIIGGVLLSAALVSCGGGGGSAGSTGGGGGGTTPPDGSTTTTTVATMTIEILSGAGAATSGISAVEIAQAKVTVKTAAGVAAPGIVVTFSEAGGALLTFAPASKTALTNEQGVATIEVRAVTTGSVGATVVAASANVASQAVNAQKSIAISSAPPGGGVVDPQVVANALNFLDVNPADRSIVLAGSGGNGRSESATLRFRVVDSNNTPVQGTLVNFAIVPAGDVTLNIASATSDADGVVVTTVSSKNVATAVVIRATVATRTIVSQSDQLLVTTGVATAAGFDLSSTKYNMNAEITGDSTQIKVAIVDVNGNPVADGVPVVFTTDFGRVGSSAQGGCTTLNGECEVTYVVQNPRPPDGTLATVTASTRVGDGTAISDSLQLNISRPSLLNIYSANTGGSIVGSFNLGTQCTAASVVYVGTAAGLAAPAGTSVGVTGIPTTLSGSVVTGSPILDARPLNRRTPVSIQFNAAGLPDCVPGGAVPKLAQAEIKFTSGIIIVPIIVNVTYPGN